MPIFEYRCQTCGNVYEIFHKVREVAEDVVCPSCRSTSSIRLISTPIVKSSSMDAGLDSSCSSSTGSCCGGSCGVN
jgi:putative FmdB family regulatory protein